MPIVLDPEMRRALAARIRYYHELGIYDFYRRELHTTNAVEQVETLITQEEPSLLQPELREEMSPKFLMKTFLKCSILCQNRA